MRQREPQAEQASASRGQRKRDAQAREGVGQELMQTAPALRSGFPLPADLREALDELDRIGERGAHKRQLKYVGRLLREMPEDQFEAIVQALAALRQEARQAAAHFNALEKWRERLLKEGLPAMEAWHSRYPATDMALLQTLVERARRAQAHVPADPAPYRQLFRHLRTWMMERDPDTDTSD